MTDATSDTSTDRDIAATLATLHDGKQWAQVVALTDAWLEARGELPAACHHWRSSALQGMERYEEAVPHAMTAAHALQDIPSQVNLAIALDRAGAHTEAQRLYRHILRLSCIDPEAKFGTALAHLRLAIKPGQWRQAWREYEGRIGTERAPDWGLPSWDGTKTCGPVVVLHEQGIGDAILLSRYLPWVAERSGHPVIWAGPATLHRWVARVQGVGQCVLPEATIATTDRATVASPVTHVTQSAENHGEVSPQATVDSDSTAPLRMVLGSCIVRMFSLPHLHGTTPATIPPPGHGELGGEGLSRSLMPLGRGAQNPVCQTSVTRVGVCWKGDPKGHHDFERSMTSEQLRGNLPDRPDVEYWSLQYGHGVEGDVWDVAEQVASCDLVVTVDTSIGHIAGSLGIPTLVLPPVAPDWRYPLWYKGGTESPWYPSQTVIRRMRSADKEAQAMAAGMVVEAYVAAMQQVGA